MLIDDDTWVTVRYRLFDSQGDALEPGERELTYLQGGYGSVFPRIEQALAGHAAGYSTSVYLEPEDSFGDYDPELVRLAPRARFPDDLEVGMTFEGVPGDEGDDEGMMFIVTDISDEAVVLDANHPLAGMALRFELVIVDVRAASAEEVARERALADEDLDRAGDDTLLRMPAAGRDEDVDEGFDEATAAFLRSVHADDEGDADAPDRDDDEDREGGRDDAPPHRLH